MKRTLIAAALATAALTLTACSSTQENEETIAVMGPINTTCPLSGHEVPEDPSTLTYKGHTVAFCCDACVEAWPQETEEAREQMLADMLAMNAGG
jgi:nitrous oxide reductase accessory protein NosL